MDSNYSIIIDISIYTFMLIHAAYYFIQKGISNNTARYVTCQFFYRKKIKIIISHGKFLLRTIPASFSDEQMIERKYNSLMEHNCRYASNSLCYIIYDWTVPIIHDKKKINLLDSYSMKVLVIEESRTATCPDVKMLTFDEYANCVWPSAVYARKYYDMIALTTQ